MPVLFASLEPLVYPVAYLIGLLVNLRTDDSVVLFLEYSLSGILSLLGYRKVRYLTPFYSYFISMILLMK